MYEYKLQIGCLLVVTYIFVVYTQKSINSKIRCNRLFDALLAVSPWMIIFDGATAYTVNHLEKVPNWINVLFHGIFLVLIVLVVVFVFLYMHSQMVEIKNSKHIFLLLTPAALSLLGVLIFLKDLRFEHGKTTNYSMGASVYACYFALIVYGLAILFMLMIKRKAIEKKKIASITSYMVIIFIFMIIQVVVPEALLSSLLPMISIIGIYMNFEDPSLLQLQHYNEEMVMGFATLVENRDDNTGGHIKRTREYVKIILHEMMKRERYNDVLAKDYVKNIINAAPMHDIGKIATPDHILQKPGKLTTEEFEIMKEHAPRGGDILKNTFSEIHEPEYQKIAFEVARYHHEKWNGKGYPEGLVAENIPLHARIMAIADVFDAVSAKRCYRDAMPIETCFKIIEDGAGEDFDPELVEIFMSAKERIIKYYEENK